MISRKGRSAAKLFPRGLSQPEDGFRFSVDSLLLSCFTSPGHGFRIADLGCGCGVIGLGLILASPEKDFQVAGLDKCPEMIAHSRKNAELLGLCSRFSALHTEMAMVNSKSFEPGSFDLVVSNPPYRNTGSGRTPVNDNKQTACFCGLDELDEFFRAGSFLLKNRGKFNVVFRAERMDELLPAMNRHALAVKRIMPVYGNISKPARLVLAECVKNSSPGMTLLPPLILYNKSNTLTRQALEFCPFLGCNPGRGQAW